MTEKDIDKISKRFTIEVLKELAKVGRDSKNKEVKRQLKNTVDWDDRRKGKVKKYKRVKKIDYLLNEE